MHADDTEVVSIVISSNKRNELAVKCNLSYIDNLGDEPSDHSAEDVELVVRTIRLLGNICDDVLRTWKAKGGDVSGLELRSYSGDSNTSVSGESRSRCGSGTTMSLRKRKAINYDERRFLPSQEIMGTTGGSGQGIAPCHGNTRTAKRTRSDIAARDNLRWMPEIVLDVQQNGGFWEFPRVKSVQEANEGDDEPAGSLDDLFNFSVCLSQSDNSGASPQVAEAGQQATTESYDESCWIRTPPRTQEVLKQGADALGEITNCIQTLSPRQNTCLAAVRVSKAVGTESAGGETEKTEDLPRSARHLDMTKGINKEYIALAHKIKNLSASDNAEDVPERSCRDTSKADDATVFLLILRMMQGKSVGQALQDVSVTSGEQSFQVK